MLSRSGCQVYRDAAAEAHTLTCLPGAMLCEQPSMLWLYRSWCHAQVFGARSGGGGQAQTVVADSSHRQLQAVHSGRVLQAPDELVDPTLLLLIMWMLCEVSRCQAHRRCLLSCPRKHISPVGHRARRMQDLGLLHSCLRPASKDSPGQAAHTRP